MERETLTKSNVSDLAGSGISDTRDSLELQRGVIPEKHLGSVLDSSPTGVDEFLDKDLAKDTIGFLAEDGAEDNRDTVVTGLDVDSLLLAVVDSHNLAALADTLRGFLGCVLGCLLLQLVVLLVSCLERCSHGVALQQRHLHDQRIFLFCMVHQPKYHPVSLQYN